MTTRIGVSPYDYGALGGGNDDTVAVLAAAAAAQTDITRTLYLDDYFTCSRPIRVNTSNTRVIGASLQCGINMTQNGPALVVAGTESALPYVTTLTPDGPGGGHRGFDWTGFNGRICLNDNGATSPVRLNGFAHLMIRGWYKPSSLAGGYYIISSTGALTKNDTFYSAFDVLNSAGFLSAMVTVNGVQKRVTSNVGMSVGSIYFFCVSFDGTTLRLYQGGQSGTANLVGSIAATGTITMQDWEDVVMGGYYGRTFMPGASLINNGPNGVTSDINIEANISSSVGEPTGSTMSIPTGIGWTGDTKFTMTLETGVTNWSDTDDMVMVVRAPANYAFVPVIRGTYPSSINGVRLGKFSVGSIGQGILLHGAQDSILEDIKINAASHCVQGLNNCYNTTYKDLLLLPGSGNYQKSAAGLLLVGAAWLSHIWNLKVQGGGFGLVVLDGSGAHTGGYLVVQRYCSALISGLGGGGEWNALDYSISDESGSSNTWLSAVILDSVSGSMRDVGFVNSVNSSAPFITWDHDNGFVSCFKLEGIDFTSTGSPTRHVFRGPYVDSNWRRKAIKSRGNHFKYNSTEFVADGI